MKSLKNLNLGKKLGKTSWGGASATLRKMPIWQRVVSAIVAFLLVFLLWPADAAKTITAWANDAETQFATEEGVTDPDPESPDPGGGGEVDPEVDPVPDPEPEPEADPTDGPQEEGGEASDSEDPEFDKNAIYLDSNAPVNGVQESCGPFQWDFSAYKNNNRSFSTVNTEAAIQKYNYLDTNKCGTLQFVSPFNSNNDKLDGGASSVTENGFVMNAYHRLKGSTNKNTDGQIFSNYIIFTPTTDLLSITISAAAVSTKIKDRLIRDDDEYYPWFYIMEVDDLTTPHYSTDDVPKYSKALTSTSYTDIYWDNNGYGLKANKHYLIFFKPNTEDSYYADYGGGKINNIKAEPLKGYLEVKNTGNADDTLTFSLYDYEDPTSLTEYHLAAEATFDTVRTAGTCSVDIGDLNVYKYKLWTLKSNKTGLIKTGVDLQINEGRNVLNTSIPYPKIVSRLINESNVSLTKIKVEYEMADGTKYDVEKKISQLEPGDSADFEFPVVITSGIITLSAPEINNSSTLVKFCEVSFEEPYVQEINVGDFHIKSEPKPVPRTCTLKALEYGETDEISARDFVDVYMLINTTTGSYYQKKIEIKDDDTFSVTGFQAIRLCSKPYGLSFKLIDPKEQPYIQVDNFTLDSIPSVDKKIQLQIPKYTWNTLSDINETNEVAHYSCTATSLVYDFVELKEKTVTSTVTTKSVSPVDGTISRDIIKRATTKEEGIENLTAEFALTQYFTNQIKEDQVIPKVVETHEHGGITYDKILKTSGGKLPTTAGNYYLDGDVVVTGVATIPKDTTINICLNGYAIYYAAPSLVDGFFAEDNANNDKTFYINQGTLNICDCHKGDEVCRHYIDWDYYYGQWRWVNYVTALFVDGGILTGAEKSAIHNEGTLTCTDVNFIGNANNYNNNGNFGGGCGGGAIRSGSTSNSYSPKLTLNGCTFKCNLSQGAGGAVLVGVSNESCNAGQAWINNCHFSRNSLVGETSSTSGYYHPWGGGALATFSLSSSNPVIYIDGSEFYDNTSNFRAGAIMLFHGTKCYMSNTTVQHNLSGLYYETGKSTSYNYAGGICVYTGYGDQNKNNTYLYLSGKIICTENHSETKENGRIVTYEDNLGLQIQAKNVRGYIYLEQGKLLDPSSVIGVNYIDNHNLDISQGYGASYVPQSERQDPIVKYFILDEVADRLSYALLIDMSSYELWIVSHTHKLSYENYKSRERVGVNKVEDDPQEDMLSVKCSEGTSEVSGHTFSKCKYAQNECALWIHSEGFKGLVYKNEFIPYDGKQHGVVVDNKNEFEGIIGQKPVDYNFETNPDGILYVNLENNHTFSEAPSQPGFYAALIRYYDVQIENGKVKVDTGNIHYAISEYYEIRGPELTINVGEISKVFDGTNEAVVTDCWIADEGKIVNGDDVRVVLSNASQHVQHKVYSKENEIYVNKYSIDSYDEDAFVLEGKDAYKYSIGKVAGRINITSASATLKAGGSFALFDTDEDINLKSFIDFSDNIKKYADKVDIEFTPRLEPCYQYSDVGILDEDTDWYKRYSDNVILECQKAGHELFKGKYGDKEYADARFFINKVTNLDLNTDGHPEFENNYFEGEITGYLVLNSVRNLECTFVADPSDKGRIMDAVGKLVNNLKFVELGGKSEISVKYNSADSALEVTDMGTGVNKIYIRDISEGYYFQKWTFTDSSGDQDVPVYTPDSPVDPLVIKNNGTFTCHLAEIPVPKIEWTVQNYTDPSEIITHEGKDVHYMFNIKNVGNCDICNIQGAVSADNASERTEGQTEWSISTEPGVVFHPGDTILLQDVDVKYLSQSGDFKKGEVRFSGLINGEIASGNYGYSGQAFLDNSFEKTYATSEINASLDVSVVPDLTYVKITDTTQINYTISITNTGNMVLNNGVWSSQVLGTTNELAFDELKPGQTKTINKTLSNINEAMIANNEIICDVFVRSVPSYDDTKVVDGSASAKTVVEKEKVAVPTPKALVYDGTQQVGVVDPYSYGLDADANLSNTDAGTYTVWFTLKPWYAWQDSSITTASVPVTYTISPATLTAKFASTEFTREYNGQVYSGDISNNIEGYYGDDPRITDATFTTKGVNAKKYIYSNSELDIHYTEVPNYTLVVDSNSNATISPKKFDETTIGIDTTDKIYNGNTQFTNIAVWDITLGENPTLLTTDSYDVKAGASGENVGEYTLEIWGKGNYAQTKLTQNWYITKSSITVALTGKNASKVYSGDEQSVVGASVEFTSNPQGISKEKIGDILMDGVVVDPSTISAKGTDVGSYCMFDGKTFSLTDASKNNIDATFITNAGYLTITKKSIEDGDVTVNGFNSLTFNGNEQDCGISVTYNGKTLTLGTDYSVVDNKFKNVGSYKAKITALGNNFTGSKDFDWAITVKDMPITHESFNKEYDATFLTDTFNFKPFDVSSSDEFKVTVQTSSDVVGTYLGSAAGDPYLIVNVSPANETTDLDNYNLSWATLSASISRKALRVVPQSRSFEYDGFEHSLVSNEVKYLKPGSTEDGLLTNHYVDVNAGDVTWSDNNKATDYTAVPIVVSVNKIKITSATIYDGTKKDVTENYEIDCTTTANLEITKLKMTIDVVGLNAGLDDSERIFYDGKEHSITGYKAAEKRTGTGATQTGKFDIKYLTPISDNCSVTATTPGEYKLQYNGHELTAADFAYSDTNIAATINYDPGVLKISKNVVTITVNESKNMDGNKFVHKIITDKSSDLCEVEGLAPNEGFSTSEDSTLTTNDVVEGCYDKEGTTGFSFTADLKWDKPEYASHYELSYFVKLTIKTQLVVTITGHRSNDSNVIYYDGQTHTIEGYESSGSKDTFDEKYLHMKPASVGKDSVSGINAGKYDMGLTANDFYYDDPSELNPEIVVVDGYLIIKQKELKDEMLEDVQPLEMEYNGQTQGPTFTVKNGASVLLTGRDFYVDDGTGVDAGTYKAVIHGQGNYTGQIKPVQWKITKATVKFEITGNSDVRQYNGKEHTVSGYTYKVDKLAPFIKDENLKLESDKGTITKVAAGEYKMNLEAANFSYENDDNIIPIFKVKDGSLTIQKRKLSDANVYLDPDTYVYDGAQHEPAVIIKDLGNDEPLPLKLFNISGETIGKNAGTYKIKVDAYTDDSNYDGVVELPWTIEKVYMEINISGTSKTEQYNGKLQKVEGYSAEKVSDTGFFDSSKITGGKAIAEGTNAGLYYMHLIASDFKYNDDNQFVKFNIAHDGCLEITPIDINTFDVSVNPSHYVYNGEYQEPKVNAQSEVGQLTLDKDYIKEGAKAKNVGDYQLKVTGIGNYTGERTFDWVIVKADVDVLIQGNKVTADYDGKLKTASGYKIKENTSTGLIDSGVVKVLPDVNACVVTATNAGTYPMNLYDKQFRTDNNNVNFTYTIDDGSLTIAAVDVSKCTFAAVDKVYNGKEQNAELNGTINGINLVQGEDFTLSGAGIKGINASPYEVTVTGKGNFTGTTNVAWNITKAPVDVHINANSKTFTYDGTQHTVSGFTASSDLDFFVAASISYDGTVPSATATNAGTTESAEYVVSSFKCSDANITPTYKIDQAKVKLVINPAELTVSARAAKFYDSSNLSTIADIKGLVGTDVATATVTTTASTPGIYNVLDDSFTSEISFTPASAANNYYETYDVELNILATSVNNTLVIYGPSAAYTFDGTEKTLSVEKATLNDFKYVANFAFDKQYLRLFKDAEAKGTNAGTYKLGLTNNDFRYTDTSVENLKIVYYDGLLTITPKQITSDMITEFAPTAFIYNTKEQGPTITAKDGERWLSSNDYEVENGKAVDAGIYNATIKGKGNYTGEVTGYTWVINKANVVVNIDSSYEYDGEIFRYTIAPDEMVGKFKDDEIECEFATSKSIPGVYTTNDGTVTYKYEGDNLDNYNIHTYVALKIDKRELNVYPTSKTYVYDGLEHKLLDSEIVYDGLLNSHYVNNVNWPNNSLTNVGTKNNVAVEGLNIFKKTGEETAENVTNYYSINYHPASLTVTPANIAIQVRGNSGSYAYDGQSHKVSGYEAWEVPFTPGAAITGTFDKAKLVALNECIAVGVEPGTYNMGQDETNFVYEDSNYNNITISYEDGSMTITKNSFDSAVMDVRNLTYNGKDQQTSLVVNMYDDQGHWTSTLKQGVDYELKNPETALKGKNAGTYDVTIIGKGKYEGAEKTTSWVIKKADVEIAITGVNATKEYNGKEQVFPGPGEKAFKAIETSATGLYKDESQISVASGHTIQAKGTDLGTYPLGINVAWLVFNDQQNVNAHFTLVEDGSLTIKEADISNAEATATSFVYNGAEQTTKITVTHNNVVLAYGVDYEIDKNAVTSATEVGRYQAKVKGIGNYKGVKNDIYWEITKANMTIKVTGNTLETEYTGYEQSVSGFTSEAVDGAVKLFDMDKVVICSGKPALAKGTDKGVYTTDINYSDTVKDLAYNDANINATFIGDKATSGVITQVKLTINAKKLQINAMDVKNYDGQPLVHSITTKDVDGAVSGQIVSGTVTTNSSEAGTYTDTKLDITIKVDGKPDEGNLFYMLFGNGEDPRQNYDIVNTSSLVITNDEQNYIIVKGNVESFEYNGEQQSLGENPYTVSTNIEDFDPSKLVVTGDLNVAGTNAGDYYSSITKVTYNGQESENYTFTDAKLTITKRSIREAVLDKFTDTFYYNAKGQQPEAATIVAKDFEGTKTLASGTDYLYRAPQAENTINPGTYIITLDADAIENSNYKGKLDVNYMIFKASRVVNVSGKTATAAYDGSVHSVTGYTFVEEKDAGEPALINAAYVTPAFNDCVVSGTTIGNYPMGLNASEFEYVGADKDFINVQFKIVQDGNLEITAGDASSWTVTLDQTEFTYNGKAQGPNVVKVVDANGNVIDPSFYDVTGNSEVNANVEGNYELTVTAKGSYSGEKKVAWRINKASRVVEIYGEQSLENVYNGSMQYVYGFKAVEVTGEAESIVDPDKISPSKEEVYAGGKNVGTYKKNLAASMFSYGDANNVNVDFQIKQDVILKIGKCDINNVTASLNPEYLTYNHQIQNAPTETLKLNDANKLIKDTDYTISGDVSGTNVGEYTLKITAVNTSNFTGERLLTWHIVPAVVDIYINGDQINKVYDGQESTAFGYEATPSSTAVLGNEIIFSNEGESVPSISGTDAGVYPYNLMPEYFSCTNTNVVATFHIQSDVKVTISRKNVADNDVLKTPQEFTYSGDTYTSQVTLKYNGMTLTEGAEEDFVVTNNTGVNAGDYTAKVEGKGNYEGYADVAWVIHKLQATVTVNGAKASYEYDGYEHCAMGYTLSIASERQEDANRIINPNLVTPGKGSFAVYGTTKEGSPYKKSLKEAYGILPSEEIPWSYDQGNNENVDLSFVTGSDLELIITDTDIRNHEVDIVYTDEFEYNGSAQSPVDSLHITIHKGSSTTELTANDYELVGDTNATNVLENGSYSFSIVGKGNYTGQLDNNTWRIVPVEKTFSPTLSDKTFDGNVISASDTIAGVGEEGFTATLKTMTNKNGVISDGVNVGTYAYPKDQSSDNYIDLVITPNAGTLASNYVVNVNPVSVKINPANFSSLTASVNELTYNGFDQTAEITLTGAAEETLVAGRDFTITGNTGKDAGEYTATLTNINPNYTTDSTGTKQVTWSIGKASLPKYTYSDSKDYDGKIWQGTNDYLTGINNEKFSISFETNSANAGTYTEASGITTPVIAEIEGSAKKDNYNVDTYEKAVTITINQKPIDPDVDPDIDIFVSNPDSLIYDSTDKKEAVKALIKVQDDGEDIDANNYEITFPAGNAINAGDYSFTVTGKENYTGTYTGIWSILPAPVTYDYRPDPHTYDGSQFTSSTTLTASTLSGQIFGSDSFDLIFKTLENELAAVNVGDYYYPGQTGQKRASMSLNPTGSSSLANYSFTITAKLTITKDNINNLYKAIYEGTMPYNGADQMPDISVVLKTDETTPLDPSEYTIVGDKYKNVGNYGFYIQAKDGGNFTGTIGSQTEPLTWTITQKNVPYVFTDNVAYTGNNYSKDVKLSNTDGLCLSDTVTVTFKTYLDDVETGNAGVYEFNAATTGTSLRATYTDDNYAISFTGSKVMIKGKSIDPEINSSISVAYTNRLEYAATQIAPNDLVIKDGETTLVAETDYTTNLDSAKQLDVPESGGYTFTITGIGNYSGSFDNSWTIYPKTVEVPAREGTPHMYDGQKASESYNIKSLLSGGDDINLWFTTLGTNAGTYKYITETGDQQLLLEKERVAGSENVLRDYELTIKGMTIKINPRAIGTYTVSGVEDKVYNAQTQTLELEITDGYVPLQESDYRVEGVISAKNVQDPAVASGNYEFHIVANSPNFTGEIWKTTNPNKPFTWKITPVDASYVFSASDFTYNAKPYENFNLEINSTTATGIIDGDRIGLTVTSSSKDVGTYSFANTNDGTLSAKYSGITTLPRNYNISISGSVEIVPKTLNPDVPAFDYPEYNGEEQSPEIIIIDTDTGETVSANEITWSGDTSATNVNDSDLYINAVIDGNYTGSVDNIPWNIRPKAITIKIAEEKIFDGQTIKVEGQWPGVKEEYFDYEYETTGSDVGTYTLANETVTGGYTVGDETLETNYAVTEDVSMVINAEPTPDVPEYVPGQTGDNTPLVGFAIMALTLIGAFLFLRRTKKVQGLHTR